MEENFNILINSEIKIDTPQIWKWKLFYKSLTKKSPREDCPFARKKMSTSSSGGPIPPWLDLPGEITAAILQKVGTVEILTTLPNVCKYWRSVCQAKDLSLWRSINMGTSSASWDSPLDLYGMCCYAVDRSQGQLTHVTLRNFGCDSLLRYISER